MLLAFITKGHTAESISSLGPPGPFSGELPFSLLVSSLCCCMGLLCSGRGRLFLSLLNFMGFLSAHFSSCQSQFEWQFYPVFK